MNWAIYARRSRATEQQVSIDTQIGECEQYAKTNGIIISEIYVDPSASAYSRTKPRPEYSRLLDAVRAGHITGILVWHTDRLYRRVADLDELITIVEATGLEIRTVQVGELNLNTPAGQLMGQIMASVSQHEVAHMVERIKAGHRTRAAKGTWRTGAAPFGYDNAGKGQLSINDFEAETVRIAVDSLLSGKGLLATVRTLNESGRPPKRGEKWAATRLKRTITSPTLAGLSVHNGEVVGKAQWEPIITEVEFEKLTALLTDPSKNTHQGKERVAQGSGVYKCGVCGRGLGTKVHRRKGVEKRLYRCYDNHLSIMNDIMDSYINQKIIERLKDQLANNATIEDDDGPTLSELISTRTELETRQTSLGELFAKGLITEKQLVSGNEEITSQLADLHKRINSLATKTPLKKLALPGMVLENVYANMTPDQRANLIRSMAEITVLRVGGKVPVSDRVVIAWK